MRWYGFGKMQTLPPLTPRTALFLDFDGTLVDIAPRPEEVIVSPVVITTLQKLHAQLEGALAIVSGRELAGIDSFLSPLILPAAGAHGGQLRQADGSMTVIDPPDLFLVSRAASRLTVMHPNLLLENKTGSVALHYRQAPELETLCLETLTNAVCRSPGTELLRGKFVFEVKAAGVSKGGAITAFMARQPFAGRVPLFAGDDLTDEDGFAAVQQLGGHGLKVGDGPTQARNRCASPAEIRTWLAQAAATLTQGAPA